MSFLFRTRSDTKYSTKELLSFLSGDEKSRAKAIQYLFKICYPKIVGAIRKQGGTEENAKEVFQHSLHNIIIKFLDGESNDITNLPAYLIQSSKNQWLNQLRSNKRMNPRPAEELLSESESPANPYLMLEKKDLREAVHELLSRLEGNCKDLLLWSLGEGMDMKTIAGELNYKNAQTATNRKSKCKKKLKELVRGHKKYQLLIQQVMFQV